MYGVEPVVCMSCYIGLLICTNTYYIYLFTNDQSLAETGEIKVGPLWDPLNLKGPTFPFQKLDPSNSKSWTP